VIATKYTMATRRATRTPAAKPARTWSRRGRGQACAGLNTTTSDLLQLHAWDGLTPVERSCARWDDLVSAGKVVYLGISDTPRPGSARMQAIADLRGWAPLVALQIEYSLIERTVERELIPMAAELGAWVCCRGRRWPAGCCPASTPHARPAAPRRARA